MKSKYVRAGVVLGVLGASGCNLSPEMKKNLDPLVAQWNKMMAIFMGDSAPRPSVSPSPLASGLSEFTSEAAKRAKANAEILHEMFEVVFNQEPKDRAEFGNWADTLNQGASFEGVYNGLSHSENYRKLEATSRAASVEALRVFSEELALIESNLPRTTEFDELSASPLPEPDTPKVVVFPIEKPEPTTSTSPRLGENEIRVLAERYSKQFVATSLYTLKRILCEEALKLMAYKSDYKQNLANWYAKWALHMSRQNVDFGISLRNLPDEAFHFKWALNATDDQIKWEVINRIHRLLNEANRHKQ